MGIEGYTLFLGSRQLQSKWRTWAFIGVGDFANLAYFVLVFPICWLKKKLALWTFVFPYGKWGCVPVRKDDVVEKEYCILIKMLFSFIQQILIEHLVSAEVGNSFIVQKSWVQELRWQEFRRREGVGFQHEAEDILPHIGPWGTCLLREVCRSTDFWQRRLDKLLRASKRL